MASNNSSAARRRSNPNDGLEDILTKSCELMATRGYDGTSMRDLAHATERSLSGLYHYFRSKEELLFLINFHGFTRLNAAWEHISEALTDREERLFGFVYFHLTYFVQHMDEMRVMTWGTRDLEPDKARTIQELKNRYADHVRTLLTNSLRADNGHDFESRRVERQMYLLFGMMNWIYGWYTPRKHGSLADLINDVYITCKRGFERSSTDEEQLAALHEKLGTIYSKAIAHGAWDRSRVINGIGANRNQRKA